MSKVIHIVTRNKGKIMAAKNAFSKYNIQVKFIDKNYPEIQADSSVDVAKFIAIKASKEFNVPVVREDHSLFINALGFPGPYTSFIEKRLSAEKLLKILDALEDRSGYFEVAAVYAEPNGFTKTFVFRVPIIFSKEIRGTLSGGWNRIIMLQGEKRTLAEYPEEERINIWNKNYIKIAKYIFKK